MDAPKEKSLETLEEYKLKAKQVVRGKNWEEIVDAIALQLYTIDSLKLENQNTKRDLEIEKKVSSTDSLTGLLNRSGLIKEFENYKLILQRAVQTARDTNQLRNPETIGFRMFTVMWVDMVGLKQVNDNEGMKKGDKKLQVLGDIIRATALRPLDLKARFGGDDFIIALINTDEKEAYNVVARMQGLLDEENIKVSVGIAAFSPDVAIEDALYITSVAMEEAKKLGKKDENFRSLGVGVFTIDPKLFLVEMSEKDKP